MKQPQHDYSQYEENPGSDDALQRLSNLAEEQAKAEAEVLRVEGELKAANERLRGIAERDIPELMDSLNIKQFETASGLKIKVEEKMFASIPAANKPEAFSWLEGHGHADIIKRSFKVSFGRDEEEVAAEFAQQLRESEHPLNVEDKKEVHASTLAAFCKEQIEAGVDLPMDLFGAYWRRRSKIG